MASSRILVALFGIVILFGGLQAKRIRENINTLPYRERLSFLQKELKACEDKNAEKEEVIETAAECKNNDETKNLLIVSNKDLLDKVSNLETEMTSMREERDRLKNELSHLKSNETEELQLLDEQIEKLRLEQQEKETELQAKLTNAHQEVQECEEANTEMAAEVQNKTVECKKYEDANNLLTTANKDLTDKVSNLETEMASMREERDRLKSEGSLQATLDQVKEQTAEEADERIQTLEEEHRRAKDELWERLTDEKEKEAQRIEQEYKLKLEKIKEQCSSTQTGVSDVVPETDGLPFPLLSWSMLGSNFYSLAFIALLFILYHSLT